MIARLQIRILEAMPPLEAETPKELLQQIRKVLNDAQRSGALRTAQEDIYKNVVLSGNGASKDDFVICGGKKDFKRIPENASLIRNDRAWLHFSMAIRAFKGYVELLAYNFEIVFPPEHNPLFVRLDLNPPGHENELRGLRSHVHPGNDDLQIPAPCMTPLEILEIMLHRLRPRNPSHTRM